VSCCAHGIGGDIYNFFIIWIKGPHSEAKLICTVNITRIFFFDKFLLHLY
ncbi:hypothetical protein ACJX0J_017442, partial [Zea mays]